MKEKAKLIALAAGHGVNDFIAGYLLGLVASGSLPVLQLTGCFVLYNILAFGGQYGAALLLQYRLTCKWALVLTWILNILALSVFAVSPLLAFVFAGCGSALYHVAGGSWAASQGNAAPIGLFAAPGVVGLVSAGYAAWAGMDLWMPLLLVAFAFGTICFVINWSVLPTTNNIVHKSQGSVVDRHDLFMILLLAIIALRSALWNVFQMLHEGQYEWLLVIAGSAFLGKVAGGWLADRIGWRLYSLLSLSAAAPLVSFFSKELTLFCIGIALLQSGIPANTALLIQCMQHEKEKAIAVSFGVAIVVGGGISYLLYSVKSFKTLPLVWMILALFAVIIAYGRVSLRNKVRL